MATSPLFGWEEPDDVDLVKDGAAAIRTLGNAIDTSMGDLLGGTTGQVLSKASNTNMDFTWVTSDDANAIQNAIVDAKGDLIAASAADTPARLAVGTNGQVLSADSTASAGLAWVAPGGWTLLSTTNLSGASTTISSINQTYKNLRFIVTGMTNNTADGKLSIKHNGYSDSQYIYVFEQGSGANFQNTFFQTASNIKRTDNNNSLSFDIIRYSDTAYNFKPVIGTGVYVTTAGGVPPVSVNGSFFAGGVGISSLTFANSGGTFSAGQVFLYGGN